MSRWTEPLLKLATDPKIKAARYGFSKGRSGGAQYPNPQGWGWVESPYNNCVTAQIQFLHLGRRMLGDEGLLTLADWKLGCLWAGQNSRGGVLMAHQWGIAEKPEVATVKTFEGHEGQWFVCLGSHDGRDGVLDTDDDTGHAFLALVHMGKLVYLESNGKAKGGSVLGGLDGVGSRHAEPRCSRDWPVGNWPSKLSPDSIEKVLATYDRIWAAKLL
jgi:hypothetical protein